MSGKLRRIALPALVALALVPVYLATLAPGLTWAHDGADGGDLITAAAVGGVAHPTGYPTYLLLARLFQFVPFGSLAYRTNLLSATAAALAAAVVVLLVVRSSQSAPRFAWAAGLAAGLGFGLSPVLWSQAVIAEVYTLHALLVSVILLTLLPARPGSPSRSPWFEGGAGLVFGLALGNHLTTVLLLPAWLAATIWRRGRVEVRPLLARLLGAALGVCVYLLLPLRARAMPPVNWGNPSTWSGFWWLVSAQPYRGLAFGLPAQDLAARLQAWAGLLIAQFGGLGLLVGVYGLFFGRSAPAVKWITGWTAAAFSVFAIGYGTADSYAYLLPAFLSFAVWVGLGVATALAEIPARLAGFQSAAMCLFVLALLLNAGQHLPGVDASHDAQAEAYGQAALAGAPPRALIFTQKDRDTFSLWYFHYAQGERPDVAVVVEPMLMFDWYRESVRHTYPGLTVPNERGASWQQAVAAANPDRPRCDARLDGTIPLTCAP